MKNLIILFVLLMASATIHGGDAKNFRDLFNGKDFDGWVVEGPAKDKQDNPMWSIADGKIVCLGKGFGFLRYEKKQFSDFVLRVEYRFDPPVGKSVGNSGIGIRTISFDPKQSTLTRPSYASWEIQLMDDAGKAPSVHTTASLYRYVSPTVNAVKAAPEWNAIDIECVGPRVRISLNGQKVLEADHNTIPDLKGKPAKVAAPKDKALSGYVALQSHSGKVEFRKVQIKELPKARE